MPPPWGGAQHVAPAPHSEAVVPPIFRQKPGPDDELRSAEHWSPDGHSLPPAVHVAPMPIAFAVGVHALASVPVPASPPFGPSMHPVGPCWPGTNVARKHISLLVLSPYVTAAFVVLSYVHVMRVLVPLAI